jgi:hypothetical protein
MEKAALDAISDIVAPAPREDDEDQPPSHSKSTASENLAGSTRQNSAGAKPTTSLHDSPSTGAGAPTGKLPARSTPRGRSTCSRPHTSSLKSTNTIVPANAFESAIVGGCVRARKYRRTPRSSLGGDRLSRAADHICRNLACHGAEQIRRERERGWGCTRNTIARHALNKSGVATLMHAAETHNGRVSSRNPALLRIHNFRALNLR